MSKLSIFILTGIFVSFLNVAESKACSCMPLGETFFETVQLHNQGISSGNFPSSMALTIVVAEVKEYKQLRPGPHPTEMILSVSDVLQGKVTTKEIMVEGDNGMQCRPYVTRFPIGKKFVFAVNELSNTSHYYISVCGEYSLNTTTP